MEDISGCKRNKHLRKLSWLYILTMLRFRVTQIHGSVRRSVIRDYHIAMPSAFLDWWKNSNW